MFGWIHECVRQLVCRNYGNEIWKEILIIAKFDEVTGCRINHYYKDEESYRLVNAVANVVGIPVEEVWEAFGRFLIQFTMETGWDELLRAMALDFKSFLDNLDALHYFIDHVVYKAKLKGPSFRCDTCEDGSLTLHYYSKRSGLYPIVKGVVREIARQIFNVEITMHVAERRQEMINESDTSDIEEHVVFRITEVNRNGRTASGVVGGSSLRLEANVFKGQALQLTLGDFATAFPYHICFDRALIIQHCGVYIHKYYPTLIEKHTSLPVILKIVHPEIPMSFDNFMRFINGTFVFKMNHEVGDATKESKCRAIQLKGQMIILEDCEHVVYICSPYVTIVSELLDRKLYLGDIPLHDATRDLILLNQSRMSHVELNQKLAHAALTLKHTAADVEKEKEKSDRFLRQILPAAAVDALKRGEEYPPKMYKEATVLFAEIIDFARLCFISEPVEVTQLLEEFNHRLDRLATLCGVHKIATIGDGYLAVGGIPDECPNHAERVCNMALGILWEVRLMKGPATNDRPIMVRIGVHTGWLIAGVFGKKMPRYSLLGDTIAVVNRIESISENGQINISSETHNSLLKSGAKFHTKDQGFVTIEGCHNPIHVYALIKNVRKTLWDIVERQKEEHHTTDGYEELHGITWTAPADAVVEAFPLFTDLTVAQVPSHVGRNDDPLQKEPILPDKCTANGHTDVEPEKEGELLCKPTPSCSIM